ncbi:hypothetical protein SPFM9_00173 [Salmonella phage SPFM9]|nr:hypothetical protein SPFM9_00173 [Salmonella phage SPFM9]
MDACRKAVAMILKEGRETATSTFRMCIDRVDPNSAAAVLFCIYIAISTSTRTAEQSSDCDRGNGGLLMNLRWPIGTRDCEQERRGGASG